MIERIVSGGQNGVDQAALRAARAVGITTGGWAPRGWTTLDGAAPWLANYDLVEHARTGYAPRTEANVRDSDATLRLVVDFFSPGEKLTIAMIDRYKNHTRIFAWLPTESMAGSLRGTSSWTCIAEATHKQHVAGGQNHISTTERLFTRKRGRVFARTGIVA